MKAAFCRLLDGVLGVCWERAGITGLVAFAVAVAEFWSFLSDICGCASSHVILLFCLFLYRIFHYPPLPYASPLRGPLSIQAFLLLDLSYGIAFNNLIFPLFPGPLPSSGSSTGTGGWVCLPYVSIAAQLPLQQCLAAFGKCQKTPFYFCRNSWNYRGQAVSCNAVVLPGPVLPQLSESFCSEWLSS